MNAGNCCSRGRFASLDRRPRAERSFPLVARWLSLAVLALVFCLAGSAPALAADGDGDGFEPPADCNDGNGAIHPGATEICNGVDDDCDGFIDELVDPDPINNPPVDNDGDGQFDEGFGFCAFHTDGPGPAPLNVCVTAGRQVCMWPPGPVLAPPGPFGTLTCVNPKPDNTITVYEEETIANGNCADGQDNDCDGAEGPPPINRTDIHDPGCQQPETCDGFDNDGDGVVDDGYNIGQACSAGVGGCLRNGVFVCSPGHLSSQCSVTASSPKNEGAQFGNTCANGVDDNCNGATDLADGACAGFGQAELCGNNLDDDGDGQTDEGFPTLGLPCSNGAGACAAAGVFVCNASGTGTECGATPNAPGTESEAGGTCGDFLDNDCDGFVDAADGDCGSAYADLGVTCSLPYTHGKPGSDCNGKHEIQFGAGQADQVKADLLALDASGGVLGIIENVQAGEAAQLASRNNVQIVTLRSRYKIHAPIPLLRVTGKKGSLEDVAYCSILPYLEVTKPDGVTLSLSEGNDLDVGAFLPLVNVDTLQIKLNGMDLLASLGINAATAFPNASGALCTLPGSCVFQVAGGCGDGAMVNVEVSNLRVEGLDTSLAADARNGVEVPNQVNTVSFNVKGLPPGGHVFHIAGQPLPLPRRLSTQCNRDDLADSGKASAFGIAIESPTDQQVVATAPVTVEGTVCGGYPIADLRINGKTVNVSIPDHQTCVTGDGVLTSDECVVNFSEEIPEKDLSQAVLGSAENASFKRGSNRVVADATDSKGNRTFNTDVIFGLGPVQTPQPSPLAMERVLPRESNLDQVVMETMTAMTTEIDPAFVVGLDEAGVQKFFNQKCQGAIDQFSQRASASLSNKTFVTLHIEPDCSCNLHTPVVLETLTFTPTTANPACKVDFQPNQIGVKVNLPDVFIQVGAHDSCTDHGLFGECIARTKLNVTAVTQIKNVSFEFTITENQIETKTPPDASAFLFKWSIFDSANRNAFTTVGHCDGGPFNGRDCYGNKEDTGTSEMCGGAVCVGFDRNEDFKPITHQDVGIECWGADICLAFEAIGAFLVTVLTFGLVDGFELVGFLDFDVDFNEDFLDELKASQPDAMALDEVEVDEEKVSQAGHTTFTPGPIDVEVEEGGLTVAFGAEFSLQSVDPSIPTTPPPSATDARVPTVAEVTAVGDDITMLVADDVFAQVFAAMRTSGALQANCTNLDGLTLDDLLPAESAGGCDSLGEDNEPGAILQGICHAIRGADCLSLTGSGPLRTNTKRGVCVGFSGGECTVFPALNLIARTACALAPYRNIHADDGLVVCARQDVEPVFLIQEDDSTDTSVDTDLILEDLNVMFALDRGADGYTGELEALPGCFAESSNNAPDCKIYAACADLTLKTRMGINSASCKPNQAGFVFSLLNVIPSSLGLGVLCSAATQTDDPSILSEAVESIVVDAVANRAEAFTPPICVDGLDLNGVLDFNSSGAKLFGLTTDGGTGFADYLGITVGLIP